LIIITTTITITILRIVITDYYTTIVASDRQINQGSEKPVLLKKPNPLGFLEVLLGFGTFGLYWVLQIFSFGNLAG